MKFKFGLLGDSSIYTKRTNKKKTWISQALRPMLPGKQLEDKPCCGGGVEEFNTYLEESGHYFETLGISYFGNEHTERPMHKAKHLEKWQKLFRLLRTHVKKRVVFFMGGYAAKYGYGQVYDDNMKIIRRWIRDVGGFECRTDFDKVHNWPLATDKLHFDVACLPELAEYWKQLLTGNKMELKEAPVKRKRCLEEIVDERLEKRVRASQDRNHTDAWKDCILALPQRVFQDFPNVFGRRQKSDAVHSTPKIARNCILFSALGVGPSWGLTPRRLRGYEAQLVPYCLFALISGG